MTTTVITLHYWVLDSLLYPDEEVAMAVKLLYLIISPQSTVVIHVRAIMRGSAKRS